MVSLYHSAFKAFADLMSSNNLFSYLNNSSFCCIGTYFSSIGGKLSFISSSVANMKFCDKNLVKNKGFIPSTSLKSLSFN